MDREIAYHEKLYSGFAQSHFARPAVRAFRADMVRHLVRVAGIQKSWSVLSLGCGIGDTELLLAPYARDIVGVDASPTAVREAHAEAARRKIGNVTFLEGKIEDALRLGRTFDAIIAVFLLHHLPDDALAAVPQLVSKLLVPGGVFVSIDPSKERLVGVVGKHLFPQIMKKYQSPDERPLHPRETAVLFQQAGFKTKSRFYDFGSTAVAGLLPGFRILYEAARLADHVLIHTPKLRQYGGSFEVIARKPISE